MDIIKCNQCKAELKSEVYLNEDGVCETCIKLGIGTNKKKEDIEVEKREEENKKFVEKLIDSALKKYGILQCCECGEYFFRKAPAMKKCGNCKGDN